MDTQPQSRSRSAVRTPGTRTPSRRSTTNFNKLTLHALTAASPHITDTLDDENEHITTGRHSSYIAGRSAPTTPGILSKPSVNFDRGYGHAYKGSDRASKSYAYLGEAEESMMMRAEGEVVMKSKSTAALLPPLGTKPRRKRNKATPSGHYKDDDWLYRAGATISLQNLESKGQSWLVSRDSSTNLAPASGSRSPLRNRNGQPDFVGGYEYADAEDVKLGGSKWGSRYGSRVGSRAQSRVVSARQSRRGSVAGGSRLDMTSLPAGGMPRSASGYFGTAILTDDAAAEDGDVGGEPDFVDAWDDQEDEPDESRDEEELRDLAEKSGFGLGGIVDRLVGWSLFERSENGEGSDKENGEEEGKERGAASTPREGQAGMVTAKEEGRGKRKVDERVVTAVNKARGNARIENRDGSDDEGEGDSDGDGEGGWKDAAWLLSVASKVLF